MDKKQSTFVFGAPLFLKILGGIVLPLFILFTAFSVMTFRVELRAETNRGIRQSEQIIKIVNDQYLKLFSNSSVPPQKQTTAELRQQVRFLQTMFKLERVDILHPIKLVSLVDGHNLKDKKFALEAEGLTKSLVEKRKGRAFHIESQVKLFSKNQSVYAYIPFRHKDIVEPLALVTVYKTSMRKVFEQVFLTLVFMFVATFFVGLIIAIRLTYRIVRPIQAINQACNEMLSGKMGHQVDVHTGDEIETMARNFNKMSQALMVMKRKAEDANPLTQLPGNKQIMAELERRIDDRKKFVYFHVDIDHFKAFNDAYGLGKGDDVLRRTSELLREAAAEIGEGTFVGHQGGDDFVLITEPHLAEELGQKTCKKFDAILKDFYDKETLERGYFTGEDARHEGFGEVEIKRHAVMSVSLAGVSNMKSDFTSYDELLQGAVRVKKKVKKIPYSKSLIEELRSAA